MSGISRKLMGTTAAAGGGALAIEDVFSTYLYTGNGSTQTITNGIDLAGEGGLVWIKDRNNSGSSIFHHIMDTEATGLLKVLWPNDTSGLVSAGYGVSSFNSDGYAVNIAFGAGLNNSSTPYASWTFRKAPRFFDVVTYTGDGTGTRQLSHNLGTTVGSVFVKTTSVSNPWIVWHRGMSSESTLKDYYLQLNTTDSIANTFGNIWGSTNNVTDSTFQLGTNINQSGVSYVAYLFAHDPLGPSGDGSDGLIACGSYTETGSDVAVDLGWEPQWLMVKRSDGASHWFMYDTMRGLTWVDGSNRYFQANTANAEDTQNAIFKPTPTGFTAGTFAGSGANWTYIAIRRGPMRQPESGTEVFAADIASSSGTYTNDAGFPVDLAIIKARSSVDGHYTYDRMRGTPYLWTQSTQAETASGGAFDSNTQFRQTTAVGDFSDFIGWMFRRAPGFFDVVAYTGDGTGARAVPHNLGVPPEWIIFKRRDASEPWYNYHAATTSPSAITWWRNYLQLESTQAAADSASFNEPDANNINLSSNNFFNGSGKQYVVYLFATLPGVSKVGSYTGNGTSQTINCGFTTGARFVLIKRTDSTGDWYVWDTARGIVTGNDPFLELNTTDAEVTSDDSIDPASSGFIVNQTATTNVNVSSASYIFMAIS